MNKKDEALEQQAWQGLTDDESIELIEKCTDKTDGYFSHLAFSNAIEQALKAKNGY